MPGYLEDQEWKDGIRLDGSEKFKSQVSSVERTKVSGKMPEMAVRGGLL